jgi:phage baseplate assembly protein W
MNDYSPTRRADLASSDGSFVGRGFSWPLEVDRTGSIKLTDGVDDLDRSIRMVLLTAPGARLMRPDFGCRIWDLLFEPVTANLLGLIAEAVRDSLTRWEPRITVDDVDPDDSALIRISISYRVRVTNDRRNLVYPFYVIPHEPET